MVTITIDGNVCEVPANTTILEAAASVGIKIPTLCYLKDLNEVGGCRVCVVEVEGAEHLVAACNNIVLDGMVVHTNTPKVRAARMTNVELLLSQHDSSCTSCVRSGNCTLQTVANDLGIYRLPYKKHVEHNSWDRTFPLIRDNEKCIRCLRCIQVCEKVQGLGVWDLTNRASHASVDVCGRKPITEVDCAACGQCITHCPVGALRERDDTERVFDAMADPNKVVMFQIAPAVRTSWGEELGLSREEATVERLCSLLHAMGASYVFDTDFSADLTIMEEGSELLHRIARHDAGGEDAPALPLMTSCCPGWVRYVKARYPQFVPQVSTSKSPQQMFGAMAKTHYADALGVEAKDVFCVSVMPCVAKKTEAALPTMVGEGGDPDVDVVLTVREVVRMIRASHMDPASYEDRELDRPLGFGTGAGVIFGTTGGVMEAALRSAYFLVVGENPAPDAFKGVRGCDGWREAVFDLNGRELRVAVAHGLANAGKLLDALERGAVHYDFVEVMACPGGCVGGGGQPIQDGVELADERAAVLRALDHDAQIRFSHENPDVAACYRDFLCEPLSELSEKLLHTDHTAWDMP
ncbi:[FeFe] hydrogenase, group A [Collinsella bouchesdurhonensis]|uniref:[FeFe] hydrogenase, group A n=1 Tax=Collinsella bouchesdurhonensis TaxID=1907654 RepID=UPI00096A327D|nr:[FeFe] hydrogenase, group A [Collinsella bouchesdurhonensis]